MRGIDAPASGPATIAALRDAILKGREPPPARMVASLASYRWLVVGTVCIGAFMGQVDSSITQLLLPRLELEFNARLSTVSWVAVAYLLAHPRTVFTPHLGSATLKTREAMLVAIIGRLENRSA